MRNKVELSNVAIYMHARPTSKERRIGDVAVTKQVYTADDLPSYVRVLGYDPNKQPFDQDNKLIDQDEHPDYRQNVPVVMSETNIQREERRLVHEADNVLAALTHVYIR